MNQERKTIQLIQRLVNSGNFYSLMANASGAFFNFMTFFILVRMLDASQFGIWVIFMTVASLLDMFRLGLTGTAAIRLLSIHKDGTQNRVKAASYQLSSMSSLVLSALFILAHLFLRQSFSGSPYMYILLFYPMLSFANLPYHQAQVIAQGQVNFKRLFLLRTIHSSLNFSAVIVYVVLANTPQLGQLIAVFVGGNALGSLIISLWGHDGLKHLFVSSKKEKKEILNFGKYSTASYVGSNLLRSSDTILLSLFPFMGPVAVATLAVPFKFVEFIEIPLRSFTATAFPRLSNAFKSNLKAFQKMLFSYTFWTTLLLAPVIALIFLMPETLLNLLSGEGYQSVLEEQKSILRILVAYIIVLPLDRYSGVALFAINKPKLNFNKIFIMLLANLMLDFVAIYYMRSLTLVTWATVIFTGLGIALGWRFLFKEMGVHPHGMFKFKWRTPKKAQVQWREV